MKTSMATKASNSTMPSSCEITPSNPNRITASVATTSATSMGDNRRMRISNGAANAARPRVKPKLTMLLPTALPKAKSCAPTA